jgi:hypothetical protein
MAGTPETRACGAEESPLLSGMGGNESDAIACLFVALRSRVSGVGEERQRGRVS